ncbi:MAG: Type 1 glutamine amidotransferase-like domain-containing protein [bacterium]
MTLLLTSTGLSTKEIQEFFVRKVVEKMVGQGKSLSDATALIVAYAQNAHEQGYVDESVQELTDLGLSVTVFNLTEEKFAFAESADDSSDKKYDVVYVCGGNTFAILERMKKTGIDTYIESAVCEHGALYVGVSAGSIIAGPSIEIAGWGSEGDPNDVNLQNLSGFSLTDISIFPHFRAELSGEVAEFQKKVSYSVTALTDTEALWVDKSAILYI